MSSYTTDRKLAAPQTLVLWTIVALFLLGAMAIGLMAWGMGSWGNSPEPWRMMGGWGGGWWWAGVVMMTLGLVVVLVVVWTLLSRGEPTPGAWPPTSAPDAVETARMRYARGEIDAEQFRRLVGDLRAS